MFTPLAPVYEGASIALSAVLANEGILKQGTYLAVFKVFADSCGVAWEKAVTFTLEPEGNGIDEVPLATPVLNETIQLDLVPGVYTFAAELLHGGMACANRQTFRIATKMPALPDIQPVMAVEVTADDLAFFKHIGLNTVAFDPGRTSGLLIIGHGNGHAANPDDSFWTDIHDFLTAGGKVLVCSATAFPDKDAGRALKIGP